MDHTRHTRLSDAELSDTILTGAMVFGPDNENIGYIAQVQGHGPAARALIDVGGFLGLGAKQVLVPVDEMQFLRDDSSAIHALSRWSKDDLKAMPDHPA